MSALHTRQCSPTRSSREPTALGSDAADFPSCRGCQTWPQDQSGLAVRFDKAELEQRYAYFFTYHWRLVCITATEQSGHNREHVACIWPFTEEACQPLTYFIRVSPYSLSILPTLRKTETTRWLLKTPNTTSTHFLHLYPGVLSASHLIFIEKLPMSLSKAHPSLGSGSHPALPTEGYRSEMIPSDSCPSFPSPRDHSHHIINCSIFHL